jgi:hypothetical protein
MWGYTCFRGTFWLTIGVNVVLLVRNRDLYITANRFAVRVAGKKGESYTRVSYCSLD